MVGKREDAWHSLGQRTDTAVSWEECARLAGLDWEVIKQQNYARVPNGASNGLGGKPVAVNGWTVFRATDGQELGQVGPDYTVLQNKDAFRFVDTLLEANGGSHYDSAGALGKGERIWVAVRVPKADIAVAGQDKHESYLVFTTSHDGSMAHTVKLTSVRVVCQNTLQAALRGEGAFFRVKHTAQANARLARARELMTGVTVDAKILEDKLNQLANRSMTRETYMAVMDRLFPKPKEENASTGRRDNILEEITRLYESNDNGAFMDFKGTAYNLLNAVTEYTDHFRSARITEGRKGMSVERARAENAVAGTGDTLKAKALEVILETTAGNPVHRIVSRPIGGGGGSIPDGTGAGLLDAIVSDHSQQN